MSALTTAAARARSTLGVRPAPTGAPRGRPSLRVVPRRRHTGRYLALMLVVGAVGIFGIVSLSALAAESAFAARALEGEIDELAIRYDELTAEVAGLESPARVRGVATTQLGMVPADQPAYLIVERSLQPEDRPTVEPASDGGERLRDPVKQALGAGS